MHRLLVLFTLTLTVAGCDTLFPEFFGSNKDAAPAAGDGGLTDLGASPHLSGVACLLGDVRDYRSCAAGSPGVLRITVEETRDVGMSDATGHFSLPLSQALTSVTIAVIDPTGIYAPSIIAMHLPQSFADGLALPIVQAQTLTDLALQNGQSLDQQKGSVLAWAIDETGAPVAGVTFGQLGALVDGAAAGQLEQGTQTGARGAIALLQAAPTTISLTLAPPSTLALAGDTFPLPVRAGALTVSTLVLVPR